MKRILVLIVLFLTVMTIFINGQRDWSAIEIKATKISDNLFMLEGAGGNIGALITKAGTLIVDTQYAQLYEKIKAVLKENGNDNVKYVINTHLHGDHTSGNPKYLPEAEIIAHRNVYKWLAADKKEGLPTIVFDNEATVYLDGNEIRSIYLPNGHTDSDCVIFFPQSKTVHMGDLLFSVGFPYIDQGRGGNVFGFIKNIEKLLEMIPEDYTIIAGHGPLFKHKDLEGYHDMLVKTTGIISGMKKAGKTLEEAKKAGLPEEWKKYSWNFINEERWIEIVYKDLEK